VHIILEAIIGFLLNRLPVCRLQQQHAAGQIAILGCIVVAAVVLTVHEPRIILLPLPLQLLLLLLLPAIAATAGPKSTLKRLRTCVRCWRARRAWTRMSCCRGWEEEVPVAVQQAQQQKMVGSNRHFMLMTMTMQQKLNHNGARSLRRRRRK